MPSDLQELIARVEGLEGPDREVELDLWRMFYPAAAEIEAKGKAPLPWLHCYTASLDASIALCERVLPGWVWYVEKIDGIETRQHVCQADVWIPSQRTQGRPVERVRAGAPTPAIAVCLATLRALAAQEDRP